MDFTASLVAVVDVAWKLVQYLQSVKDGEKARERLLYEVTFAWNCFRHLQAEFEPVPPLLDKPWMEPLEVLAGPTGISQQLFEELGHLESKLSKSSGKVGRALAALQWPFDEKQILQMVDRLHRLNTTATLAISQSYYIMGRKTLHSMTNIESILGDEQFQAILAWLSPLNFLSRKEEVLSTANALGTVNSDTWVLESEEFTSWLEGNVQTVWCHGAPGAGKSVLAASIYTKLMKRHETANVTVLIAFCSSYNEDSQSADSIAAGLLKEILQDRGKNSLLPELKQCYTDSLRRQDGSRPSLTTLITWIRKELESTDSGFIILDGLDEVGNDDDRIEIFDTLHSFRPKAKIMVTSRHLADARAALENTYSGSNGTGSLDVARFREMEFRPRKEDIKEYVIQRLESEKSLKKRLGKNEKLTKRLITGVIEKSKDIFLLARLHMNSLTNCLTISEIQQCLDNLSGDLDTIYVEALRLAKKRLSEHRHNVLQELLLWVSWAERPLSVEELEHSLAILRQKAGPILPDSILPIREITIWSAGLVSVDEENLVRAIHATSESFLIKNRQDLFPDGDGVIAHACLDYLTMVSSSGTITGPSTRSVFKSRCQRYPFLEYAVLRSWRHVQRSQSKDDDIRAVDFLRSKARGFLNQALYFIDPMWNAEQDASALHVAAHFGLLDVTIRLANLGEDVNAQDPFGVTPLMYAAEMGDEHLAVVDCLLLAGADPAHTCQAGSTALLRAVCCGAGLIVDRLLKESNIKINAVARGWNFPGDTALMLAIQLGNRNICDKILTRPDVDVNARTKQGFAALHIACEVKSSWGVSGLLSRPEIVVDCQSAASENNTLYYGGVTPLFSAAISGHDEGLDKLLENGADLKHLDNHKGNVLMRAADEDQADMVRRLIRLGVDVTHQDFLDRTALHSAAINQSWNSLRVILEEAKEKIDVNCQGKDGGTPLHDVCSRLDPTGTEILVAAGARCDIRNKNGLTPVDIAKQWKGDSVLEILTTAVGWENLPAMPANKSLHEAVKADPIHVLERRIKLATKEDLNEARDFEGTPLYIACCFSNRDVVLLLLKAGADPNIANSFGRLPLHAAIQRNALPCVEALVSHAIDSNLPVAPEGAWEYAMSCGLGAIAIHLLENGAHISRGCSWIQLALPEAVRRDNVAVTKRLVEAGASVHLKAESTGLPAVGLAETHNAKQVLSYFAEIDALSPMQEKQEVTHSIQEIRAEKLATATANGEIVVTRTLFTSPVVSLALLMCLLAFLSCLMIPNRWQG